VEEPYDLAVIGGGINGCGIARDAAGRGLSVYLCEKGDLASGTSSKSTKLIHGGLRYLEYREFRLVREALLEREMLWALAPHLIRPLRFVLPHHRGLRPAWMLRLGLYLYDHLGGRKQLPPTTTLDLRYDDAGRSLKPGIFIRGFEYSDCWVDDARLVVLNALDAAERGAKIETRAKAASAHRVDDHWSMVVETGPNAKRMIKAKALINATGPWVGNVLSANIKTSAEPKVRLVQGSHLVVRKLFDHDRCYIFQSADGRIVFAIPYESEFTLIGTTDTDYDGDPDNAAITDGEITYLCSTVSEYFQKSVKPDDIVWTYTGVRPLYDDGVSDARAATRDYVLDVEAPEHQAPLLSVFGGKITTYRRLSEAALERLTPYLPALARNVGWTALSSLPGGDLPTGGRTELSRTVREAYPFLSLDHIERFVRTYGTRCQDILAGCRRPQDLGAVFGATLTEAEVRYLMREEWAATAEDVLWRRTKLGLELTPSQISEVESYMKGLPAANRGGERFLMVSK
jgi:glycerol-3-phosphate dehydrogenase